MIVLLLKTITASITTSINGYNFEHTYSYYEDFEDNDTGGIKIVKYYPGFIRKQLYTKQVLDFIYIQHSLLPTGTSIVRVKVDDQITYGWKTYTFTSGIRFKNPANLTIGEHLLTIECQNVLGQDIGAFTSPIYCISNNIRYVNSNEDELVKVKTSPSSVRKKPVLIVEGFDPGNTTNVIDLSEQ